jgi:uncharacterized protein YkwD
MIKIQNVIMVLIIMHFTRGMRLDQKFYDKLFSPYQQAEGGQTGGQVFSTRTETQTDSNGVTTSKTYRNGKLFEVKVNGKVVSQFPETQPMVPTDGSFKAPEGLMGGKKTTTHTEKDGTVVTTTHIEGRQGRQKVITSTKPMEVTFKPSSNFLGFNNEIDDQFFRKSGDKFEEENIIRKVGPDGIVTTAIVRESRPVDTHIIDSTPIKTGPSFGSNNFATKKILNPTTFQERSIPTNTFRPATTKDGSNDMSEEIAKELMVLLNDYRHEMGLNPVAHNSILYDMCLAHNSLIMVPGQFEHHRFKARIQEQFGDKATDSAENIGMVGDSSLTTPSAVAERLMKNWQDSGPHNANMLHRRVTQASVGVSKKGFSYYATMILVRMF